MGFITVAVFALTACDGAYQMKHGFLCNKITTLRRLTRNSQYKNLDSFELKECIGNKASKRCFEKLNIVDR
ncbi:hypothetical protein [Vallitalea maricola]